MWLTNSRADCGPARRFFRQLACKALKFNKLSLSNHRVSLFTVSSQVLLVSVISFRFTLFTRFGGLLVIVLVVIAHFSSFIWLFLHMPLAAIIFLYQVKT